MFIDLILKRLAELMKRAAKFNPEDIEKLNRLLMKIGCKGPFDKLMQGLRWKMIMNALSKMP